MFGEIVRAHRRRLGLTQEELASRTGVSVRGLGKIEANQIHTPRPATVRLLADAFRLTGRERDRFCQAATGTPTRTATGTARVRVPAQLPPDVPAFTGRAEQLDLLDAALADPPAGPPAAVVISALSGTAGVGKTALAIHWAHRVADRFPDGQLYLNLHGYGPDQPMAATDALARCLASLGVAAADIPADLDDRAARYRSELSGRRVLIVLDNAATAEQVRPLLPGSGSCVMVVTSRDRLAGLVAVNGARRIELDLLPPAEAVDLLGRLIGPRAAAEPEATEALVAGCARLPLALRVAAELAISRPTVPLPDLVAELGDQRRGLELLDGGGDPHAAVTVVFSWSMRHLPPPVARTFRLLGLHTGPDIDAYATAALADTSLDQARHALDLLDRAHLVHLTSAGRYGMHDLMRAYAARLTFAEDGDRSREAAVDRVLDHYLATAGAAMDQLYPAEAHSRPRIPTPATPRPDLADPDAARTWLDTELPNLVASAGHGPDARTILLSSTLHRYLESGRYSEALTIHGHALRAAERTGDTGRQAHTLRYLGDVHGRMGHYGVAADHLDRALVLFRRAGDRTGEAIALNSLGNVEARLGRYQPAADHQERALGLFRRAGDRTGEAVALTNLGIVEKHLGRYEAATEHYEQALVLFRALDNPRGELHALTNLGFVKERLGRHGAAAAHYEQALALSRGLGDLAGEATVLDSLGAVLVRLGWPDRATAHVERALTLHRGIGARDSEAHALNSCGEVALANGHLPDALTYHDDALTLAAEIGTPDEQARAHAGLGKVHQALGDLVNARAHGENALALYADLGMPEAEDVRAYLGSLAGTED